MPSSSVCTHILQPSNVLLHEFPRVVVERHLTELGGQKGDGSGGQGADFGELVDGVLRHDASRLCRTEAVKGLEGALWQVSSDRGGTAMVSKVGDRTWTRRASAKLTPRMNTLRSVSVL